MMSREVLSYQFDDVVIDLRAGRVLRGGSPAQLEPKAYDLLLLLASRSGELVTKQEVFDRVWAGVYVTDNAVARVIAQVRRVLGDSARGHVAQKDLEPTTAVARVGQHPTVGRPGGEGVERRR